MTGRARTQLPEYITAVERGVYRLPANTPAFAPHKATTVEEVYAPGKRNSHLSDDVAAFDLAHNAADRQAPPAAGEGPAEDVVSVKVAARAHLRPGRTGAAGSGGGADGRGGDGLVRHQLTPCSMAGARRWSTRRARSSDVKSEKSARDGTRVHEGTVFTR